MIETTPEVLPPLENGRIAAFNATEAGLATLRAELEGKTFDCSDRAQDAEARIARRELVTLRTTIEQRRKELKAPLLERGRVLDDEAKRITGEVLKLEQPIDAQIKAEEQRRADEKAARERAEAERATKVAKAIDAVRQRTVAMVSADSQAIELELVELTIASPLAGLDATEAETAEAAAVLTQVTASLRTLADAAKAREEEAARLQRERAELERQRQEEEDRQRQAAADAEAERARQAEADRQAREAEQKKLDEQRRAEEARIAEERRIEQERIDQANAAERERLNAEAAALRQRQEDAARAESEKRAADLEAQRQRWASRKVQKGAAMTDAELQALTDLLDGPGPAGPFDLDAHQALADWADNEARRHGFTSWRDALAGFADAKAEPAEAAA